MSALSKKLLPLVSGGALAGAAWVALSGYPADMSLIGTGVVLCFALVLIYR
ncbi:hypothetical protein [Devosia sediminis]|uniref:Uncharacterized protein n=1 Tax=Devosia sediminis TaxID=2798801 RepID=A0A934IZX4_9HYPH|nr:hypothetical protein [Devosia sediminis]MBJ3786190.1 hypothetical protein [Devosia sediminis]